MSDLAKVKKRIFGMRYRALTRQPFYGSLAMRLIDDFEHTAQVSTAATDGTKIYWNPSFVEGLEDDELYFVLLHETMHCAHGHLWRLPTNIISNLATDYVINLLLDNVQGAKMPEGGAYDKKYEGMSEEDVYLELLQEWDNSSIKNVIQQVVDSCGGFVETEEGTSGSSSEKLKEEWENAIMQAAKATEGSEYGYVPGSMERFFQKRTTTRVNWEQEMVDFVKSSVGYRQDWSRPSRRSSYSSVIYPTRRRTGLGCVVFARDTSGSIDDETLGKYNTIIENCMADTGCTCYVIDCDSSVAAEYDLEYGQPVPNQAKGGGGTDFRPVFNRVKSLAEERDIAGIVYLTDMYGTFPDKSDFPTLWVSISDAVGPFGRTVRID